MNEDNNESKVVLTEENKSIIINWLKERLHESSSWTWIVIAIGYFMYKEYPEFAEYVIGCALALVTLIQFSKKETN